MDELRLHPEWKQLYSVAKDWEYDSFHSHEEVSEILKLPVGRKYYSQVSKANEALLEEHQKYLETIREKGYRVILPNEHLATSTGFLRRAARKYRKGVQVARHANQEKLTNEERRQRTDYLCRAAMAQAMIEKENTTLVRIAAGRRLPKPSSERPALQAKPDNQDH